MVFSPPIEVNPVANGKSVQSEIRIQIRTNGCDSSRREAREKTNTAIKQVKEEARREAMD